MHILFVLPYVPSLIRVRPHHFIRELSRRHQVSVLAVDSPGALAEADVLRSSCDSIDVVPLRLSACVSSCLRAAVRGDPLQAAVCHSPELDHRFAVLLAERRFDVVHVEHVRAAALVRLIPPQVPTVFDAVDSISLLLRRTLRSSHSVRQRIVAAIELRRTSAFEGRILRKFNRTVVTSPNDQRALQQLAPAADISVISNGVDLEYCGPLDKPREPATLVFSGKMSYHANVTAALHFVQHIFPLIRAARPEVRLRIVGSNPPRSILALGSDPAIEVTGHVPDLHSFVGGANVAVCPVTVKVGIQNKILEAMAMSVPVVATSLGADGLSAKHGRDLLVANTASEFAAHVLRLLDYPDLARAVGAAGRWYVEEYHRWDKAAGALECVYRGAIADHAAQVLNRTSTE